MDKDTEATLHRRKFGQEDRVTTHGRLEDLVRQFKTLSSGQKAERTMMVGDMEYGPQEINDLARRLWID
jgi:hypothetical protein